MSHDELRRWSFALLSDGSTLVTRPSEANGAYDGCEAFVAR
jgi:hypothetical protein